MSTDGADAAALVKAERARQRAEEAREEAKKASTPKEVELECVQPASWVGAEAGNVDDNELARRQREISERLARRQKQLLQDSDALERVRLELAALEAPLKAEIMSLRNALENANKKESLLVAEVNELRTTLHVKGKDLVVARAEKQQHADSLINTMSEYEKRKTDALNSIAQLIGEEPLETNGLSQAIPKRTSSTFGGF
jgi:chromosome segregation ATPase